jgi:hypothetical protein
MPLIAPWRNCGDIVRSDRCSEMAQQTNRPRAIARLRFKVRASGLEGRTGAAEKWIASAEPVIGGPLRAGPVGWQ